MSRNPFGWDLPPGVTQKMIDDQFGGNEEPDYSYEDLEKMLDAAELDLEYAESSVQDAKMYLEHVKDLIQRYGK